MRVVLSRMGRRHALCAAGAVVAVITACSDYFSAPKPPPTRALAPESRASATLYPKESPASQTLSISINDTNGFGSSGTYTGRRTPSRRS